MFIQFYPLPTTETAHLRTTTYNSSSKFTHKTKRKRCRTRKTNKQSIYKQKVRSHMQAQRTCETFTIKSPTRTQKTRKTTAAGMELSRIQ